jgi:hypothetical protein
MNRLWVNVLAALAFCGLAVSLAVVVLPPSLSWAAVLEALTTQAPSRCAQVHFGDGGPSSARQVCWSLWRLY